MNTCKINFFLIMAECHTIHIQHGRDTIFNMQNIGAVLKLNGNNDFLILKNG